MKCFAAVSSPDWGSGAVKFPRLPSRPSALRLKLECRSGSELNSTHCTKSLTRQVPPSSQDKK